jgi:lipopolysaccharide O-acetyltransferase
VIGKIARLVRNNGWYLASEIVLREVRVRVHSAFLARHCGVRKLRMEPGSHLRGLRHIKVGENLGAGRDLWLEAVDLHLGRSDQPRIVIGDNVWMSDSVHIAATTFIEIGSDVLIGSQVLITDHQHGDYQDDPSDPSIPPAKRGLTAGLKTIIGDKVWLGNGVVVMPGVTIGEGSIIGANSVVTRDIGAFTIAAGAPARPLKEYDHARRMWRTASRSSSPKNEERTARHRHT